MLYSNKTLKAGILARYQTQYMAMLGRAHLQQVNSIFTEVRSTKRQENYAWLGDMPRVREWVGDKSYGGLKDYDYSIKNKDWYVPLTVDRNDLDDEQISAIMPSVDMMALTMANHKQDMIIELLLNGTTELAYDGQPFFSNRSVNDNLLTGTGGTYAALQKDIADVRTAMMRFKSEDGKPMGLRLDTLVVPPELEKPVLEVIRSTAVVLDGQGTNYNPVSSWVKNVIVLPELEDTNDWYALATDFPLKPFIYQARKAPTPVFDDSEEKRNRKINFSVESRGNAGYGFPQMAVKVVNA